MYARHLYFQAMKQFFPSLTGAARTRRWLLVQTLLTLGLCLPALSQSPDELLSLDWEQIKKDASGGTVNWYMWGGSDTINNYVSGWVGGVAQKEYGVTLNRVGINDTADAVNAVLSEVEAGVTDDGSVDMIWINGENFRTMKQGNLVFCGYNGKLPNNALVDWNDPAIAYDFGTPVDECEVPWNKVQFAIAYDSARVQSPPSSLSDLLDWIKANPGRFAYPAPPDFTGSVFVRHVFYLAAGGHEKLLGSFDKSAYDEVAPKAWKILNDLEPYLWREGSTYPNDINALAQLFSNQEVDFIFSYDASSFGKGVEDGRYPETTRSYGFSDGSIGNTNYVAIPVNSPNKAAALVVANILLRPEAQLEKAKPDVWGAQQVIKLDRVPGGIREKFGSIPRHPAVVSSDELSRNTLPELRGDWVPEIEKGWRENVGR